MIHGSEELERKLEALEGIADQHMERLVRNQIKRIQAEAKLLCPVEGGELRDSIRTMVERDGDVIVGAAYTNKAYAGYVEMGTGPKGEANHSGISPVVNPSYTQNPWWIHESRSTRGWRKSITVLHRNGGRPILPMHWTARAALHVPSLKKQ